MLKQLKLIVALLLISLSSTAFAITTQQQAELPALNALPNQTSISGLSSGAFMAAQFHIAYSKSLVGAGIVAGGPWHCAGDINTLANLTKATTTCMNPCEYIPSFFCWSYLLPNSDYLVKVANDKAKSGVIDPLINLTNDKVYIFSGSSDQTVITKVVNTTEQFYGLLGLDKAQILYNKTTDAGHAFITTNTQDTQCDRTNPPYINNCDIPQAKNILSHIYGAQKPAAQTLTGELIEFDQSEFFDQAISMDDKAFVYIPNNCRTDQCKIHVAVHGCKQGISQLKTGYVEGTGYLEVADTNNIIVLFPQVKKSITPLNPNGCWDFWGYSSQKITGYEYYSKEAPQMVAIKKMIDRLITQPTVLAKS